MTVGIFNTSQITQDQARKSFAAMLTRLMPNGQAPLFGISSMLKDETAYQIEHGYFSKTMVFPRMTCDGVQAAGATTLTVDDTTNVIPGMMFQSDITGENILVTAVNSGTEVVVVRNVGNNVNTALADNEDLWMVGNAFEEASVRPQSLIINTVRNVNYTQIFRNTWAISGTNLATQMIAGGGNDAESRQDCAAFHAVDIEKALLFGQKFMGSRNGQPLHLMDGLVNLVENAAPGNITTLGATTNWTQLEAALDPAFNQVTDPKGPPERTLFVGGVARRVLHNIFRLNSTYFIEGQTTSWGLQFDTFRIPRGTFNIVEHPLFNAYGNTSKWAKMAIAVDFPTFNLAYMTGRKTKNQEFNTAGQPAVDNGIDAVGGTLTTEVTELLKNPSACVVLYNFTAAVAG